MQQSLADISNRVSPILRRYGIKRAKVFGSRARGDQREDSDLDLLIEYGDLDFSLLDHIGLQQDIRDELNIDVDVVTESAVHPLMIKQVTRDAQVIYEG